MNAKFSPEFKNFQGGMNFIKGGGWSAGLYVTIGDSNQIFGCLTTG